MKRRDLKDILKEVQKAGVKEPETIKKYLRVLGNRTLYSLMYGDRARCSEEERYECWSHLEFVFLAYTGFLDFTDEEIAYCMKHITFKDFLCLVDHLNGEDTKQADFEEGDILRNDLGLEHMQETALGYLLKLLLRAKARGDEDVNNFCMIHAYSMFGATDENDDQAVPGQGEEGSGNVAAAQKCAETDGKKKKMELLIDYLYVIKLRLNPDNKSWMGLDIRNNEVEYDCLRELMVDSMKQVGFLGEFSLPGVLERCEMMCKEISRPAVGTG